MRIRTQCRSCGFPFKTRLTPETTILACPNCAAVRPVEPATWSPAAVEACPLCGCRHLYRQRDINRAWGCTMVAIGAALVPWTFGLSLIACGLVDLYLYRRLAWSVVCYRCDTVYRDARPGPRQGEFDLLRHDVLKYGKTWEPNE
jgi:hypothetical protein